MSCSHLRQMFKETLRAPYDRPGASASLLLAGEPPWCSLQWPLGTGWGNDAAQGHQVNPGRAPASGYAGGRLCRAGRSLLLPALIQPRGRPCLEERKGFGWGIGCLGCPETREILSGNARYFNILVLLVFSLLSLQLPSGWLVPGMGRLHGRCPRAPASPCLLHGDRSAPSHPSLSLLLFGWRQMQSKRWPG